MFPKKLIASRPGFSPIGISHLLPSVLLVVAPGCGPSEADIQKLVDARVGSLQQQQDSLRQRLEEEKVIKTDAEVEKKATEDAAKADWERSVDFLASLDKLMADYAPKLPEVKDDTDVLACVSEAELAQDPNMKAASAALYADVRKAKQARYEAERAFERRKWLQFRLDNGWQARVATKGTPPEEKCKYNPYGDDWCWTTPAKFSDDVGNDEYDAKGQALYSRNETPDKPELMKRIEASGTVVPDRFFCKVEAADIGAKEDGWPLIVGCQGAPASFIQVKGESASVHIGDVVSVPLRDKLIDPMGVLAKTGERSSWRVSAEKADLKLESPAECASDEVIALKAMEKVKSPRDAAPLMAMLRASSPVTEEGKRKVAEDDLRGKRYAEAGQAYQALGDVEGMAAAARGLASANEVSAAVNLLKAVVVTKKDAALLTLLGGLEVQGGDAAGGQAHLREAVSVATDVKLVKSAMGVLQFSGDTEGVALAKAKSCELGDKRSCK